MFVWYRTFLQAVSARAFAVSPVPGLFESYAFLVLSLTGIVWALTHRERLERTAKDLTMTT